MNQPTTNRFSKNVQDALHDKNLQLALQAVGRGFIDKRQAAIDELPEFSKLRDESRDIKNHVLDHLDVYLEQFTQNVTANNGHVHWAEDSNKACQIINDLCRLHNAKVVTKGKSMVSEEIGLNEFLQNRGMEVVETDLGEYIIQLRGETPSHIIAPALHVRQAQIEQTFRDHHTQLDENRNLDSAPSLVAEARTILREKYMQADVGITGANFLVAETGSTVIVTNEGNGDMTQIFPKIHIVITTIEKIVPNLDDLATLLRVLARSATGQEMSTYTTISSGAKRDHDADGPEHFHVILLDNGRTDILKGDNRDVLRCIRCGACMNHCPVYHAIGGHAYGWVYPGPIGSVLTPGLLGLHDTQDLPNASSFCGRCEEVCPVRIPLPSLMRNFREEQHQSRSNTDMVRWALSLWTYLATRPTLNRIFMGILSFWLRTFFGAGRMRRWLPMAGNWTKHRDIATPPGAPFLQQWRKTHE